VNPTLLLAALIVVTLVLRFYRLGEWNLQATEIFTLRFGQAPVAQREAPWIPAHWQTRDRSLALLMVCLFTFQYIFLSLVRVRAPISTFYLVPTLPLLFNGAGFFLDRLAAMEWSARRSWIISATTALFVVAAGAPTLVSQYMDGRRWDFRGVARWLESPPNSGHRVLRPACGETGEP
jgi:hypothetical protein